MSQTKIDWCDQVWNPVWGCLNTCDFCYARKFAKRFWKQIASKDDIFCENNNCRKPHDYYFSLSKFEPTWLESNFQKSFPKNPSRIFVNSMSDIAFWEAEWLGKAISKISKSPEHIFLFLSKFLDFYHLPELKLIESNSLFGYTINKNSDSLIFRNWSCGTSKNKKLFVSIEPIQEKIDPENLIYADWIIIGAETGNRKNKIIPELSWLQKIVEYSIEKRIPIFMKNNLAKIWPEELIQNYPKEDIINVSAI